MADEKKELETGSLDPDVVIPPGVRAAAERAEAAHKAAYNPDPVDPQSTEGENIKLVEETPAQLVQQPPAQLVQQPAPVAQPVPVEDWKRRYDAMKGRHDHLASENRQLASRMGNLEQTLAS